MLTIELNMVQIESTFITIESILIIIESVFSIESVYHNQVGFELVYHNRVDSHHNQVDFEQNQVDSGDAHNTFFGSTILKQTACHSFHSFSVGLLSINGRRGEL